MHRTGSEYPMMSFDISSTEPPRSHAKLLAVFLELKLVIK